jgi:hypothetical protein
MAAPHMSSSLYFFSYRILFPWEKSKELLSTQGPPHEGALPIAHSGERGDGGGLKIGGAQG